MLTSDGPKLIEYNVRLGDPESEVVLPRLGGDVAELFASAARSTTRSRSLNPPRCDVGFIEGPEEQWWDEIE
jgi:phosphoribosylamine-glycine ligase